MAARPNYSNSGPPPEPKSKEARWICELITLKTLSNNRMGNARKERLQQPYLNAKMEWYDSVGSFVKAAAQWRLVAVIALTLACLSIGVNLIQASEKSCPLCGGGG